MLNKPIILVLLVLFSFSCLFGYLSYSFYGQKTKAKAELAQAVQINANLQNYLVKKEQECKIADSLVSEWQEEKDASDKQKDSDVQKIDSIPKKPTKAASPNVAQEGKQNEEIDIDGKLPDALRLLLQQSYNRDKGGSSADS